MCKFTACTKHHNTFSMLCLYIHTYVHKYVPQRTHSQLVVCRIVTARDPLHFIFILVYILFYSFTYIYWGINKAPAIHCMTNLTHIHTFYLYIVCKYEVMCVHIQTYVCIYIYLYTMISRIRISLWNTF